MRPEPDRFVLATLLSFAAVALLSVFIGTLLPGNPGTAGILALLDCVVLVAWFRQWRRHERAAVDDATRKEQTRADLLQLENEKRFRTVFEHTAQAMTRNALNGEFIEVNDAWCNMFGYSREQALAQHLSWQQLTHPDDLDPESVPVKKLLDGELEQFRVEKRYLRSDGKILWAILQVSLVRDGNGTPEYFISAIQDITER
ncbi:MAG: PAS domain S-box protein, partial [Gallionellaceae bacterium]|nr:PAS domain S-box protein [Gallionellaceae bacterium]